MTGSAEHGPAGQRPDGHAIVWQQLRAGPAEDETPADLAAAERYLEEHLPKIAAQAGPGAFSEFLADPENLVRVNTARLAEQLPTAGATPPQGSGQGRPEAGENQALVRASFPRYRHADPQARRQLLMVDAARLGRTDLTERLSERASWAVRWATGSGRSVALRQCLVLPAATGQDGSEARGAAPSTVPLIAVTTATGERQPLLIAAYETPGGISRVVAWDTIAGTVAGELRDDLATAETTALTAMTAAGQTLAAAGRADGTISIWNLDGPSLVTRIHAHAGDADDAQRSVLALTAAVVGGRPALVSAGQDGTVRSWDPFDGSQRASLVRQHGADAHLGPVRALARLGDDPAAGAGVLVTGGDDGMLRTWDLALGNLLREWRANQAGVSALAVLAAREGGPLVLSGHADGTWAGWNPLTGEQVIPHRGISETGITAIALHGRGHVLACCHDGTVSRGDLRSPGLSRLYTAHGERRIGLAVARLNGRDHAACGGPDGAVWIWDLNAAPTRSRRRGDPDAIAAVWAGTSAEGTQVVTAAVGGSITIRDHATGDQRRLDPLREKLRRPRLLAVSLTPAGQPVLACVGEDAVVVYGPRPGSVCTLPADARDVISVTVTPRGGKLIAALAFRQPARAPAVFAITGGTVRRLADLPVPDPADPLTTITAAPADPAVSGQGAATLLAGIQRSGTIRVWEIRAGRRPRPLIEDAGAAGAACAGLAVTGDELLLAVGMPDRSAELHDLRRRRPANYLTCAEPVRAVAADPAGGIVISQGQDVIALRSLT